MTPHVARVPDDTPPATLIPPRLLAEAGRILFIAHLALGDFTYLQNDFREFARAFLHLRIDLWVDEVRRTADEKQWPHLKAYSLYDWADGCGLFGKVYRETYSPALFEQSVQAARAEAYPIVVSLATLRPHLYAALARRIAPDGFVAGMRGKGSLLAPHRLLAWRKLDASIPPYSLSPGEPQHISGVYADWFRRLAGVDVPPAARFPYVDIPERWLRDTARRLTEWGFERPGARRVFVNPYAKTKKRCWPLERVAELIAAMQAESAWRDACFIVNAVPQELAHARRFFEERGLPRTQLFSAEDNFYQLPAMLSQCELIVSVETAVMHLANAVHVPVIALMRQKNPEWVPIDAAHSTVITTARRRDWVREIPVDAVLRAIDAEERHD